MKKIFGFLSLVILFGALKAQIPNGYYDAAIGLNGLPLKVALHNIIDNHTEISYSSLYSILHITDNKGNNVVWDIYSDIPSGTPPYVYSFSNSSDQCGQYSGEGDCYNKEHSWPQSWFNSSSPMYSDLFHIYPTDGYVNSKRGNLPYGEVGSASWTSLNGSKIGPCSYTGYASTVFEPIDEYKGDIARSFFYVTVRYYGEGSSWPGSDQTIGSDLKAWTYNLMYEWHSNDPVSQKETDRNNAIYSLQHNRNPFIDHPDWIDSILNPLGIIKPKRNSNDISVYPNPANESINVLNDNPIKEIRLYDAMGAEVLVLSDVNSRQVKLNLLAVRQGYYLLKVKSENDIFLRKVIKY